MKNLKKVLAFVVVFTMMFSFAVSANSFPDVSKDASYAEAVTVLSSLNVMIGDEKGNFNPDKILTRAEATALIMRVKGLAEAADGAKGATAFSDVAADHWASGSINLAYQSGVVKGMGDGTFAPESEVLYEQFVKMLVAALGYEPQVETLGGYPTGYLVVASQKNITKGATGAAGTPVARSVAARLLYNALDVNMMKQTKFVKGEEEYAEAEDKENYTLLNKCLGFDKIEGKIDSVNFAATTDEDAQTTVTFAAGFKYNKLSKDDSADYEKTYNVGNTDAANYEKFYVVAYVGEDDATGKDTIYAISPKASKNNTLELDYEDLVSLTKDGSSYKLKYDDNGTDKTVTLDDASFYYNGVEDATKAISFLTAGDRPGHVTLVSSEGNTKTFDSAFVIEYGVSYVVKEIDSKYNRITDLANEMTVRFNKDDVTYNFIKNGENVTFADIAVGDVITLADSSDKKVETVYIGGGKVEGTVTEERPSNNDNYFTIDGNEYRVDKASGEEISVKDSGVFYYNIDNRIVYKDATAGKTGDYAFLYASDIDSALGGTSVEIQYLKADGTWEVSKFASNVTLKYGSKSSSYKISDAVKDDKVVVNDSAENVKFTDYFNADGSFKAPQLVEISKNSSGLVNEVAFASTSSADDKYFYVKSADGADYTASSQKIGKYYVKNDTPVFVVDEKATSNDKYVMITTAAKALKDNEDYAMVRAYDVDSNNYPTALVISKENVGTEADSHIFVVSAVSTGNNADNQKVARIKGYTEGQFVTFETSEDGVKIVDRDGKVVEKKVVKDGKEIITKLENANYEAVAENINAGDTVLMSLDAAGTVDNIKVLMAANNAKDLKTFDAWTEESDAEANAFGFAYKTSSGSKIKLAYNDGKGTYVADDDFIRLSGKDSYIYKVTFRGSKDPIINVSSFSEIETNNVEENATSNWVYVRGYDGATIGAVIYENTNDADLTVKEVK